MGSSRWVEVKGRIGGNNNYRLRFYHDYKMIRESNAKVWQKQQNIQQGIHLFDSPCFQASCVRQSVARKDSVRCCSSLQTVGTRGGGGKETKHLHQLEQPATVQHNAKTPLTDIIITHPGVVLFFWLCIRQHNGERAVQLRDGNVAAHRDRQGCRRGGRRPGRLAKLCLPLFSNFSMLAFDS